MAFSNTLAKQGHEAERLEVRATCTFGPRDGGFAVTTMKLSVRGSVSGIDEDAFGQAALAAEQGCPISNAIGGNVDIELEAALA